MTRSKKNYIQLQPIAPIRGIIYDRNGIAIAKNKYRHDLVIVEEETRNLDRTIESLRKIIDISDEDIAKLHKQMKKRVRPYQPITLKSSLNENEIARFAVNRHRFTGAKIHNHLVRFYPFGELFTHVLGHIGQISKKDLTLIDHKNYEATQFIGKSGVEKQYEDLLHGTVGVQSIETNAQGQILKIIDRKAPIKGQDIKLHLDYYLQKTAYEALNHSGALVAIDVKTGGIMAMVSKPSIDANRFVTGFSYKAFEELQNSIDLPLFNRATSGLYPPASTIKPMLALAGLETKTVSPEYSIWDPGWYKVEGSKRLFRNWKRSGHGKVNLFRAIQVSSDTYYYDLAHKMGIENIYTYLKYFGFGQKVALDIIDENKALLPNPQWKKERFRSSWLPGDTLNIGIGQGYFLATPLQLAAATAVIANQGHWVQPRLLWKIDDQTKIWDQTKFSDVKANQKNWNFIFSAMESVVHSKEGTASAIGRAMVNDKTAYKIAGKTGTAQVIGLPQDQDPEETEKEKPTRFTDHAIFIAFAPLEKPEIAIAIVAENAGSGSTMAAPVAKQVLDEYFKRHSTPLNQH